MNRRPIESFSNLRHGDLIISPIDNEVTQFYIDEEGDAYLAGRRSLFSVSQFEAKDFYFYKGDKIVGDVDENYFKN